MIQIMPLIFDPLCNASVRQPSVRRQMIDDVGQILAETLQQFVTGQAALGSQRLDLIGAERVGEVAGRDLLVGTVGDPGIGLVAESLLLELIQEVAEAAGKNAAGGAARQKAAQAALEHVAQSTTARTGVHMAGCGHGLRRGAGLVAAEMLDAFPGQ
jgi:hypothetical protein